MDLDGRALAERVRLRHAPDVDALLAGGRRPRLVAIRVGENEATAAYERGQRRGAEAWRIEYEVCTLPSTSGEQRVVDAIEEANADEAVTGVLLQLPLPPSLHARALQRCIDPAKDVEGVHPANLGAVVHGKETLAPCTAMAVIALIESSGIAVRGAEAVVVGHSEIVGKPVALMLLARDATTTVCHKFTRDVAKHTRGADVLVVAVGKPGLVTADMVRPGAVVVDVGINAVPVAGSPGKTRLVGDVDYDGLVAKGCHVTPVPGGVGPVTVAMLLRNTVWAAMQMPPPEEDESTPLFLGLE